MAQARSLTSEAVHKLLADPQRRHLLSILEQSGTETVDDLARKISAREQDESAENVDEETRQRIAVALVHKHIPLLEDHDVVQYNPETRTVVLMDVFDELERYTQQPTTKTVLKQLIPGY